MHAPFRQAGRIILRRHKLEDSILNTLEPFNRAEVYLSICKILFSNFDAK